MDVVAEIWRWLLAVDWLTLLSGAALATLGLAARLIMREPLKAIGRDARFIRAFWWISPQSPFHGDWEVVWKVQSTRFPPQNVDRVKVRRLFTNVTFRTSATLVGGDREDCVFIGKLHERNLTGRWYNPEDQNRGYYGVFQLKLHAGLKHGDGAWAGFSNAGRVQADDMSMKRL